MIDDDELSSLAIRSDVNLARTTSVPAGILSAMVAGALSQLSASGVEIADPDSLLRKGRALFRTGDGLTETNIQAFGLFCRAAMRGHMEAQYLTGRCYLSGDGVRQNCSEGIQWLQVSAEAGLYRAMMNLGLVYLRGASGIPRQENLGIEWFVRAADAGSFNACYILADVYREREDYKEELRWYKEAAIIGDKDGFWKVARNYASGLAQVNDKPEAYAWLRLLTDESLLDEHLQNLRAIAETMSALEISEGNEAYLGYRKQIFARSQKRAALGKQHFL